MIKDFTKQDKKAVDSYKIKSVDELTFTDDFMFGTIMREAPLCHDVLECLLQQGLTRAS